MKRIRLDMVSGGNDAFFGAVHCIASRIDDDYTLVAGSLSSTSEKSQVAPDTESALCIRVCGEKGGLEWAQEDPNYLWHSPSGEPKRLLTRIGAGAGKAAARVSRVPSGHPEEYLEGFASIYTEAARAILAARGDTAWVKLDH